MEDDHDCRGEGSEDLNVVELEEQGKEAEHHEDPESLDPTFHQAPLVVVVTTVDGEQVTVIELKVAPGDLGKVIGKQGRTARSIRTILGAAGMKANRRYTLEILE